MILTRNCNFNDLSVSVFVVYTIYGGFVLLNWGSVSDFKNYTWSYVFHLSINCSSVKRFVRMVRSLRKMVRFTLWYRKSWNACIQRWSTYLLEKSEFHCCNFLNTINDMSVNSSNTSVSISEPIKSFFGFWKTDVFLFSCLSTEDGTFKCSDNSPGDNKTQVR